MNDTERMLAEASDKSFYINEKKINDQLVRELADSSSGGTLIDQVMLLTQRVYALEKAVHGAGWNYETYSRGEGKEERA
jgi:hypothetical protein